MDQLVDILAAVNAALFLVLTATGLHFWLRERSRASLWFAAMFAALAFAATTSFLIPEQPDTRGEEVLAQVRIALLLFFPYSLFRFTTSFAPMSRWIGATAWIATVALAAIALGAGDLGAAEDEGAAWFVPFLVAVLALWTTLSVISAVRLWTGGRKEPNIARQRMRLLSLGSLGLNAALIIGGSMRSEEVNIYDVGMQAFAIVAGVFFLVGFAPPQPLRYAWRRREQEELQRAMVELLAATTEKEVADALLPRIANISGGRSAALLDADGSVIGSHGMTDEILEQVAEGRFEETRSGDEGLVKIDMPFGSMVVWATSFTPFFGRSDRELLLSAGALTDLALERCRHLATERQARLELERINRELADAQALAQLGSWEWSVGENVVTWSDELYRVFGVDREEFIPTYESYLDLVHPADRDALSMLIDKARRTGHYEESEHRIVRPDGAIRWIRSRGDTVRDVEGEVVRMLGTAQDITQRKSAEEYERELRDAEVRQQQALELNDNIVQGLAVAGMALELGETDKAKDAVARTLSAAQSIITGLLKNSGRDRPVEPGDLVRAQAADLDRSSKP